MVAPNLDALNADIAQEFPTFRVTYKSNSTFIKVLNVLLLIVTVGQANTFMTDFITTINTTVYVPTSWTTLSVGEKCVILRHERVHMRQVKKYSFFLFILAYLLFPLPLGFAWARAKFEMEAYAETLRAWNEYGENITQTGFRQDILDQFTTARYGWMYPFSKRIAAWYDATVAQVQAGK
jgi:hypothetical protein